MPNTLVGDQETIQELTKHTCVVLLSYLRNHILVCIGRQAYCHGTTSGHKMFQYVPYHH